MASVRMRDVMGCGCVYALLRALVARVLPSLFRDLRRQRGRFSAASGIKGPLPLQKVRLLRNNLRTLFSVQYQPLLAARTFHRDWNRINSLLHSDTGFGGARVVQRPSRRRSPLAGQRLRARERNAGACSTIAATSTLGTDWNQRRVPTRPQSQSLAEGISATSVFRKVQCGAGGAHL